MTHSTEPWKINEHVPGDPDGTCEIMASDGRELIRAFIGNSYGEQVAVGSMETCDAERIVACVNFLQGIETEDLKLLMSNPMYFDNALQDINSAIAAAKGSCQ